MAIRSHKCFGTGTRQLGDALDCPKCWDALEWAVESTEAERQAYRELPDMIAGKSVTSADFTAGETSREIPCESTCHCSSCDPRTCSYCGRQDHACTFCKIEILRRVENGKWHVWCSGCTWQSSGIYDPEDGPNVPDVVNTMTVMIGRDHYESAHRQSQDGHA